MVLSDPFRAVDDRFICSWVVVALSHVDPFACQLAWCVPSVSVPVPKELEWIHCLLFYECDKNRLTFVD